LPVPFLERTQEPFHFLQGAKVTHPGGTLTYPQNRGDFREFQDFVVVHRQDVAVIGVQRRHRVPDFVVPLIADGLAAGRRAAVNP
jgi:hypothetical protein